MDDAPQSWLGYSWMAPPGGLVPCVVSVSYCERPAPGPARRIIHDLWVLDYSRSDCGLARVGSPRGRWWARTPRIAHLYPPRTPYWEAPPALGGSIREAWTIFDGGDQAGLRRLLGGGQRFARIADPGGCLDVLLYEMAVAGQSLGEAGFWRAQAALAGLFDLLRGLVRQADGTFVLPAADSPAGPSRDMVRAAQEYFRAHLAEKVTLAAAAKQLAMSPSAFSHRYALEAGQSPMASLAALRIEVAKGLLLRGLKMEAIAVQTGFYDAFHFSKAFKKLCGVSPSQFRRSFRRPAAAGAEAS